MEAITTNAIFFVILIRESIHICVIRHCLVECCVEHTYLWHVRQNFSDSSHTFEVSRIVKWSEGGACLHLFDNFWSDNNRCVEFFAAMHYLLLGGYTGMVANLVSCLTNGCYYFRIKKGKSTWPFAIAFSVLFVVIGFLSWHGPISIFVILAKLFSSICLCVKEPKTVRLINLIYNPFWLIYDLYVGSLAGIITDILVISSTAIAIFRLDLFPKKKD